ncbi:uncharacterized protein LOC135339496 [Halichondria panicea]|uniref:uncharacterized protein LOC135339496 n=1 Tax=Halichondria panicea TaxID=6063 RepID=UPI00312B57CB
MTDLDCNSGVIILSVVAGVHSILSLGLLACIIWCACCYGKKQFQVRPLSPKHNYSSPNHHRISGPGNNGNNGNCNISSPVLDERELKHLRLISQLEARRLQTINESTLDSSDRDRVTVTSIVDKGSPFISCQADINVPNGHSGGAQSPVLKNQHAWESDKNEKDSVSDGSPCSSNSESVFANADADSAAEKKRAPDTPNQSPPSVTAQERRREAVMGRRRAQRTNSTRPLLGTSISSDYGGSVSESIGGSCMSLPTDEFGATPSMRVLTRHAGSRKGSLRSLLGTSEDNLRNCSTLPRMHRLPPLTTSRPPSAAALSSLQTLSENVPLAAESVTNLSAIERPRPRVQSSEGESLPRLSLHLADDIGLGDPTSDDAFRSMV